MNTATAAQSRELVEHERPAAALQVRPAQAVAAVSNHEADSLIQIIAAAARDPSVDVEKMERLYGMHERLKNRAAEEAFNAAMNAAQRDMGRVSADAVNPQTRSQYATYGQLDRAVRPIYTKHGFSISFNEGDDAPEGYARILAYVSHSAGFTRTYKMDMPADGKGAKGGDVMTKTHATGAAHSYGRRYLLKDIFNIAIGEEDNDGNGAGDEGGGEDDGHGADSNKPPSEQAVLKRQGYEAANHGSAKLTDWWKGLTNKQRTLMNSEFGAMRKQAGNVDRGAGRG